MRIMVTGGAGFIGSHVVRACLDAGHDVAVLDNFVHGWKDGVDHRATVYECDVRDADGVQRAFEAFGPDAVSHQAAVVEVCWCEANPEQTIDVNVGGTRNVYMAAHEVGVQRFVLASSVGGYGECRTPAAENSDVAPIGTYGKSKLLAECTTCPALVPTTVLRYANVYGPGATGGVIPLFIHSWVTEQRPTIYGTGEQVRDFVHVSDVARANLLALEQPRGTLDWQLVNVASGEPVTINRLWAMLSANFVPARAAEIVESRIDGHLAAEVLGFKPEIKLEAGLGSLASAAASSRNQWVAP